MTDFTALRERMVARQVEARGIHDPALLAALRAVPREAFVSGAYSYAAYDDSPLPIEAGQTISQPYIVALMIEAAEIGPNDVVLEVGAGSGYAAAVIGQIAKRVVAIERQHELVALAAQRMELLGYDNVRIVEGDGTLGFEEEAPFDAILAAASGSHVPDELLAQLKPGGRLVMPLGDPGSIQNLVKLTRWADGTVSQQELGAVRFVPLIGAHGFQDTSQALVRSVPQLIAEAAEPLPKIDDPGFAAHFDCFADAKVVMLGEASHGTSEYYRARDAITRRLIEQNGFNIVAVEADWPDAATIDRYVRHRARREGEEAAFQRFPTWMWRNREADALIRWMHIYNASRAPDEDMAGFYGLDLYNLSSSMRAVIDYLDEVDPEAAAEARERYACLSPYSRNPQAYGRLAMSHGYAFCEAGAVQMLRDLLAKKLHYAEADGEEWLDAAANARLVKNAEAYYRAMYRGAEESWNLRDTHMFETLCQLLDARGAGSKAVVWAHNSHIGNAEYTEMGMARGELNIGQLVKGRFGNEARLIGFGTNSGTVAAASDWDAPMEVKKVRPSLPESYERLCHDSGVERFLLDLREGENGQARAALTEPMLERYIGVIYRPETERWSHYSQAILPCQYDGWVWFDETSSVDPLPGETRPGEDETYPFGL